MSLSLLSPFGDKCLGLGIEVRDHRSRQRVADNVTLVAESGPRFQSFTAGLFVLFVGPGKRLGAAVKVRLVDPLRTYVSRRFVIPTSASPAAATMATRVRRPLLFPGSAYPVSPGVTALRGLVCDRQGRPRPFCRIAASLADGKSTFWAHGDERGEFLLLVGLLSAAAGAGRAGVLDLIAANIAMYTPDPDPKDPQGGKALPLCESLVIADGAPDPVATGESVAGFSAASINITEVKLRPGQLHTQSFVVSN